MEQIETGSNVLDSSACPIAEGGKSSKEHSVKPEMENPIEESLEDDPTTKIGGIERSLDELSLSKEDSGNKSPSSEAVCTTISPDGNGIAMKDSEQSMDMPAQMTVGGSIFYKDLPSGVDTNVDHPELVKDHVDSKKSLETSSITCTEGLAKPEASTINVKKIVKQFTQTDTKSVKHGLNTEVVSKDLSESDVIAEIPLLSDKEISSKNCPEAMKQTADSNIKDQFQASLKPDKGSQFDDQKDDSESGDSDGRGIKEIIEELVTLSYIEDPLEAISEHDIQRLENTPSNVEEAEEALEAETDPQKEVSGEVPSKFADLLRHLVSTGQRDKVYSHFTSKKDYRYMLSYLWSLEDFHKVCLLDLQPRGKSVEKSTFFANKGNEEKKEGKHFIALASFNRCILHAEPTGEFIAKAYATRANLLYHMGLYEYCLKDISRAILNGYPKKNLNILLDMQRKAEDIVSRSSPDLPESPSKSKMSFKGFPKFEPIPKCCREDVIIKDITAKQSNRHHFRFRDIKIPELSSPHPKIPCLNDFANIGFCEEKGRLLYATQDIYPGEVIFREPAMSYTLLEPHLYTFCTYCLRKVFAPFPCPDCSQVSFCDEVCCKNGRESFHEYECKILPALYSIDSDELSICIILVRLITKFPFNKLQEMISTFKEEAESKLHSELGFNEDGIYSSTDYRTIYHLVNHKDKHLSKRNLKACCNILLILKVLHFNGGYISKRLKLKTKSDIPEKYLELGETLFRHYQAMFCNAYRLNEISLDVNRHPSYEQIAMCVSSLCGLVNNSCCPNAMKCNYGPVNVLKSLDLIPKGSEINISYGKTYVTLETEFREQIYEKLHYFKCKCMACKFDWLRPPTTLSEMYEPLLRCTTCRGPFLRAGCDNCKTERIKIEPYLSGKGKKRSWLPSNEAYDMIMEAFNEASLSTCYGIRNEKDYHSVIRALSLLKLYSIKPDADIFLQQPLTIYIYSLAYHFHLPVVLDE